jgi:hypothetical protein
MFIQWIIIVSLNKESESGLQKKRQPFTAPDNLKNRLLVCSACFKKAEIMATYRDPIKCFAPLEVIERLLEIRAEFGYAEALYLDSSAGLAEFLDAIRSAILSKTIPTLFY